MGKNKNKNSKKNRNKKRRGNPAKLSSAPPAFGSGDDGSGLPDIHRLVSSGYYNTSSSSIGDLISVRDEETGATMSFQQYTSQQQMQQGGHAAFDFRSVMSMEKEKEERKPGRQFQFRSVMVSVDSEEEDDEEEDGDGDEHKMEEREEDDMDVEEQSGGGGGGGKDDDGGGDAAAEISWEGMGMDRRLVAAVRKLGFEKPSQVQQRAIPLALQQRDIIAKAATGTGKTMAYAIPAIQLLLEERARVAYESVGNGKKDNHNRDGGARVLCVVPSHELASQVHKEFNKVLKASKSDIVCYYLGSVSESIGLEDRSIRNQKGDTKKEKNRIDASAKTAAMLRTQQLKALNPHILVGTPSQLLRVLEKGEARDLRESLKLVIIDEADLVLGNQFQQIQQMVTIHLPRNFQCIMMSATLRPKGLSSLKSYLVKNHIELNCEDNKGTLLEHFVHLGGSSHIEEPLIEKILLTNYIIRYKCKNGKALVFVNNVIDGFRLYFCLLKLGVEKCVFLSPDYPMLSKYHIMDRFNAPRGKIRVLITMDTVFSTGREKSDAEIRDMVQLMGGKTYVRDKMIESYQEAIVGDADKPKEDMFNMARGIDFKNVAVVINYDIPLTPQDYVHRAGRAGRGGKTGLCISILDKEMETQDPESNLQKWEKIVAYQKRNGKSITLYDEVIYDNIDRLMYRFQEVEEEISKTLYHKIRVSMGREINNAKLLKRHGLASKKVKHHNQVSSSEDQRLPSYLDIIGEKADTRLDTSLLSDGKRAEEAKDRKMNRKLQKLLKQRKKFDEEELMDSDIEDDNHAEETEDKLVMRKKVKTRISGSHDIDPLKALSMKTRSNRGMRSVLEKIAKPSKVSKHVQKVRTARHIQRQLVRSTRQAQWTDK